MVKNSGLPWILPQKAFSLDLGGFTKTFIGTLDGDIDALPLTLGLAVAGFGFLALTKMETVLQVLGSAALVQLLSKKLLFAEKANTKTTRQLSNHKDWSQRACFRH